MARLFIAVNFPEQVTEKLYSCTQYLKSNSITANPSRKENLHLTLAFIGETKNIKGSVSALNEIVSSPFELTIEGFSNFSSKDGSLFFAKTKESKELRLLAENIRKNLTAKGFSIDTKPFKPHITLCRQFVPRTTFSEEKLLSLLPPQHLSVKEVVLMRSDRINGKLVYTPIHKKIL